MGFEENNANYYSASFIYCLRACILETQFVNGAWSDCFVASGKIVWSIQNAGESGKTIIIPAILGLVICCGLILFGFKKLKK